MGAVSCSRQDTLAVVKVRRLRGGGVRVYVMYSVSSRIINFSKHIELRNDELTRSAVRLRGTRM